jgi:hypothetical protein
MIKAIYLYFDVHRIKFGPQAPSLNSREITKETHKRRNQITAIENRVSFKSTIVEEFKEFMDQARHYDKMVKTLCRRDRSAYIDIEPFFRNNWTINDQVFARVPR